MPIPTCKCTYKCLDFTVGKTMTMQKRKTMLAEQLKVQSVRFVIKRKDVEPQQLKELKMKDVEPQQLKELKDVEPQQLKEPESKKNIKLL